MTQENTDLWMRLHQQHKKLGISEQIDFDKFYLDSIMSNSVSLVDDDYGTVIDQSEVGKWSIKPSLAEKMVDILEFVADKDQITTEEMSDKVSENKENVRQTNNLSDKLSDKQDLKDKIKAELSDKTKISDKLSDKLSDIVVWTASKEFVSTNMVVSQFGIDERNARRYLTRLVDLKFLSAEGENKNKKYRYRK